MHTCRYKLTDTSSVITGHSVTITELRRNLKGIFRNLFSTAPVWFGDQVSAGFLDLSGNSLKVHTESDPWKCWVTGRIRDHPLQLQLLCNYNTNNTVNPHEPVPPQVSCKNTLSRSAYNMHSYIQVTGQTVCSLDLCLTHVVSFCYRL